MQNVVFRFCNVFYANVIICFCHMHIFLLRRELFGNGLPDGKITPLLKERMRKRRRHATEGIWAEQAGRTGPTCPACRTVKNNTPAAAPSPGRRGQSSMSVILPPFSAEE